MLAWVLVLVLVSSTTEERGREVMSELMDEMEEIEEMEMEERGGGSGG